VEAFTPTVPVLAKVRVSNCTCLPQKAPDSQSRFAKQPEARLTANSRLGTTFKRPVTRKILKMTIDASSPTFRPRRASDQSDVPWVARLPNRYKGVRRVLVIDDNSDIHDDFRRILVGNVALQEAQSDVEASYAKLFGGDGAIPAVRPSGQVTADPDPIQLDFASNGREGFELVKAALAAGRPYELAFVDMRMPPGWDGVETIEHIWKVDSQIQTCICTAHSDRTWCDVLNKVGISDRLLILKKPFDLIEIRQITVALSEKWRMARQAEAQRSQLEKIIQSRTADLQRALVLDGLTNLPNRRTFQKQLETAVAKGMATDDYRYGLIFLDVDRFKTVNDTIGPDGGDDLLCQIGRRLAETVRTTDAIAYDPTLADESRIESQGLRLVTEHTTARIGGDEFVVLLHDIAANEDVEIVARRIGERLNEPFDVAGRAIELTVSLGVTSSALSYSHADEVLRDADAAMHRAKSIGRGLVSVFSTEMRDETRRKVRVESDLRGAAERGELRVVYQPIVRASNATLSGFEALIRWQHPTDGLLPPAAFIETAEESGLIGELGGWMLEAAAGQFAKWIHVGGPEQSLASIPAIRSEHCNPLTLPTAININLSRQQLLEDDLVPRVADVMQRLNLQNGRLKLEVTEGGVMQEPEKSVQRLKDLREIGAAIVMDDFGTGYSSLACLHQFPLDCVKLDRSFIRRLGERDEHAAVIEAIVTLTRALQIDLVAEGVETELQWNMLRDLGCDLLQGYYFGKPLNPEQAGPLLALAPGTPICDGRSAAETMALQLAA
jgi:predicted signal transduction protein with EAL and GGDEF domain